MKKGQLSVEHLVIVGLSLIVIIPATLLLLKFSEVTIDKLHSEQIKNIGDVVVYNSRDIYLKGPQNLVSLTFTLPEVVNKISVSNGDELIVYYRTLQGESQAVFFLDFPLVGPGGTGDEEIISRSGIVTLIINSTTADNVRLSVK